MIKFPTVKSRSSSSSTSSNDETWSYTGTVTVGDAVYLAGSNIVSRADASNSEKIPAIGFVSEIIDATYCKVRGDGYIDIANLTAGGLYYVGVDGAILISSSEELIPLAKQSVGRAKTSTKLQINIGQQIMVS